MVIWQERSVIIDFDYLLFDQAEQKQRDWCDRVDRDHSHCGKIRLIE